MPSIINATTTNGLVTSADNSGSLQLATNSGTTAVTIDTSQNVGIGTTSPTNKFVVSNGGAGGLEVAVASNNISLNSYNRSSNAWSNLTYNGNVQIFSFAGTAEGMRLNSDGNLCLGTTSAGARFSVAFSSNSGPGTIVNDTTPQNGNTFHQFRNNGTTCGSITSNGATTTTYGTSSDYRLKDDIAPMTGALAKVAQLKPVTYKWKVDGSNGQGFIAHELQAVVPDCVVGEKDAVDAEGNPQYQGIDTSFLVATLTAAIQELKAELDATKAEIQALKGVA